MAKPINLYQGAAPAAMAQMGQGMAEVGANIGRTLQRGYESMGQSIAGGINTAVDEYLKYKDMKSQVGASEKSYNAIKSYLPPEVQKQFDSQIESINQNPNLSLRDKAAFWDQAKSFIGSSVGQAFQLDKQQKELDARAALQAASEAAAKERTLLGIQARAEELGGPALPTDSGAASPNALMPGASFYDQGLGQPQAQPTPFGSSLKKRHFGGF